MLRKVKQLYCTCHLDNNRSDMGYRFCITSNYSGIGYAAYCTVSGLKYFMKHYGLEVAKATVAVADMRSAGHGRIVHFAFKPRTIQDVYFWKMEDVPAGAEPFIGLENGSYVTLYAVRDENENTTTIYRPNPNAKEVYRPYDYREIMRMIG